MSDRTKTSLMLSSALMVEADKIRQTLGVSKSDFASMGIAFLAAKLANVEKTTKKRRQVLLEVKSAFQKIIEEALEKA